MTRRVGVLAVLAGALALVPLAGAWTRVADLPYAVDLTALRTQRATELLAWYGGPSDFGVRDLLVLRVGGKPLTLTSLQDNELFTARPVLLQQPRGTVLLYFSTTHGVFRLESSDDGRSWRGPLATAFSATERILAGTVRPNGTPLLTAWDWDGDSSVGRVLETAQGLGGEVRHRISIDGNGSVAVTPRNQAYLLYFFNPGELVPGKPATYLQRLNASGAPVGSRRVVVGALGPPTVDRFGDVLVPASGHNRLLVLNVSRRTKHVVGRGFFLGWEALLVDPRGRLCALWSRDRDFGAAGLSPRGTRLEERTSWVEPPQLGLAAGSRPSSVALAWAHGIDLFISFDDTIVRERFRLRGR